MVMSFEEQQTASACEAIFKISHMVEAMFIVRALSPEYQLASVLSLEFSFLVCTIVYPMEHSKFLAVLSIKIPPFLLLHRPRLGSSVGSACVSLSPSAVRRFSTIWMPTTIRQRAVPLCFDPHPLPT